MATDQAESDYVVEGVERHVEGELEPVVEFGAHHRPTDLEHDRGGRLDFDAVPGCTCG